jgi:hypothetical protein
MNARLPSRHGAHQGMPAPPFIANLNLYIVTCIGVETTDSPRGGHSPACLTSLSPRAKTGPVQGV